MSAGKVTLTEDERKALRASLFTLCDADYHYDHTNEPNVYPVVESIVAERMADAWDEGWHVGMNTARAVVAGRERVSTANPYCDEAQP